MKQFLHYQAPAIVFALLIFFLSSLPSYSLPPIGIKYGDVVIHFFEFGLFSILLFRAFRYTYSVSLALSITLVIGILYAFSDEFHQLFVSGRNCSIIDFIADSIGVAVWAGIFAWLKTTRKKRKYP